MQMFGVFVERLTELTEQISVWSGAFYDTFEAEGKLRRNARRITLTTYNGDKVVVTFGAGITGPRTDYNYMEIDRQISATLEAHYKQIGATSLIEELDGQ